MQMVHKYYFISYIIPFLTEARDLQTIATSCLWGTLAIRLVRLKAPSGVIIPCQLPEIAMRKS